MFGVIYTLEEHMNGKTSIKYLQEYIRAKDYAPELKKDYFLRLSEEVGELAKAINKNLVRQDGVKNTIDEEIWDVIYYCIALANCYDIDIEKTIKDKERINYEKYSHSVRFEEGK